MKRREFITTGAVAGAVLIATRNADASGQQALELEEITVTELQAAMASTTSCRR